MNNFRKNELEVKFNAKVKFYDEEHCTLTAFNRHTFLADGWEVEKEQIKSLDLQVDIDEPKPKRDRKDSVLRAKKKVYDIAYANSDEWRYMVTLTLDENKINRYDPQAVLKPFQNWLKNCVKRKGLKALLVAEYHADGAIHFHGLVNGALNVVDSGTVKAVGHKKPIKLSTAKRLRLSDDDIKPVFNCTDWKLGFSTFVPLDGNTHSVCTYITKYITKDFIKIFGKSYFAVGDIKRDVNSFLVNIDFDEFISGGGNDEHLSVYPLPFKGGKVAYYNADETSVLTLLQGIEQINGSRNDYDLI